MEELTTREGTVQSVIFQNEENGYTVLRLVTEEGELITVVGCIPCAAPGSTWASPAPGRLTPSTAPSSGRRRWSAACRRTPRSSSAT